MRLSKTALVHFAGQVVISVAGFGATFAIARLEGESVLGLYSVAVALGFYLLVIPTQAIGNAVKKRMSEGDDRQAYFGVGLLVNGGLGIAVAVGVALLGVAIDAVALPGDVTIVRVIDAYSLEIAALVLSTSAFWTVRSALDGTKRVGTSGLLQAGERVLRTGLQVGLLVAGFGVLGLIGGHAAALAVAAAAGLAIVGTGRVPTRTHVRSVLSYARYAWLGTLRSRIYGWFDTFVLAFFVSSGLIGIYEAAWGLASLLAVVSTSVRATLFPEVSELSVDDEYERIRSILHDGLVFSGVFVIPGLVGAAIVGRRVLEFYRPSFGQGAGILVILIAAYGADVYGQQFLNVVNATDNPSLAYRVNKWFIAVSVVLTVSLAWVFGWYGAAAATASASVIRTVFSYHVLRETVGSVPLPVGEIGREVLAAGIMAAVLVPLQRAVPGGNPWTLALVGAGAAVYGVSLYALSTTVRGKVDGLVGGRLDRA
ncbi:lipopolysaccharide biosynthesis protein [Halomicrobium salinisoli]|uniref:lipopolysaccharide biosynthesis protein n=1 Tax=Halomicrobium salinisoli TaxID=2878391 RepID=UPI001CF01839|nr:lipopolysaccharide biosynthesis protein [Halomicrobium salinisoli]